MFHLVSEGKGNCMSFSALWLRWWRVVVSVCLFMGFTTLVFSTTAYAHVASCYPGYTTAGPAEFGDTDGFVGNNDGSPTVKADFNACNDTVEIQWKDVHYDFYQVRWIRPGMSAENQFSTGSQTDTAISRVYNTVIYQIIVQGCNRHWYGGSSCSSWSPRLYVHPTW